MNSEIMQAISERDGAIKIAIDKLSEKTGEVSDRLMHLEQKGAASFDGNHAPPKFPLMDVIRHLANPRDHALNGAAAEWHQELSKKNAGAAVPAGSVWIPLSSKTLDYSTVNFNSPLESAGGSNLVPTETGDLIDILRQESVVLRQGVRFIQATGNLDLPKKLSGSTSGWFTGDGGDSISESTPQFSKLELRPHFAAGLVTTTYRMQLQTGGNIERIIMEDLAATLAEAIDDAALNGSGSNSEPLGILGSGIGSLTWGGAESPKAYPPTRFWFNDAADMEEYLITNKSYKGDMAFLMDAATYRSIRFQEDSEGAAMFGLDRDGRLLNLPVTPTVHMPANTALLGNFQDLIVATWGGVALAADPYGSNFAKGNLSIRAVLPIDLGLRNSASFCKNVG